MPEEITLEKLLIQIKGTEVPTRFVLAQLLQLLLDQEKEIEKLSETLKGIKI